MPGTSSGPAAGAELGSSAATFERASAPSGVESFDERPGGLFPEVPPLAGGGEPGVPAPDCVDEGFCGPAGAGELPGVCCVAGTLLAPFVSDCGFAPAAPMGLSAPLRIIGRPSLPLPITTIFELGDFASSSVASMPRQRK